MVISERRRMVSCDNLSSKIFDLITSESAARDLRHNKRAVAFCFVLSYKSDSSRSFLELSRHRQRIVAKISHRRSNIKHEVIKVECDEKRSS